MPESSKPSFADLFTPKLVTVLREGYGSAAFRADLLAGLTVAIVALPLSLAIAVACGVSPERGLYAAIIGGFIVSALGGSRFQIGGPAGAFIVLIAATVLRHGLDGLLLAVLLSGVILIAAGLLRFGTYVKYIPFPVTVGFTAGIGLIILASQIRPALGLVVDGPEPAGLLEKLPLLWQALPSVNTPALAIAAGTAGLILAQRRWLPKWPGMLIAIVLASLAVFVLRLPVETVVSVFGELPRGLPMPRLPDLSQDRVMAVLPDAFAFALLGAIESLLSASVADGMTGRRHRSNCELVAQGGANIASALFGGLPVTGTIARTATNVRAGARGPVAGLAHAAFLLVFLLLAGPVLAYIPLAALAGVLVVIGWTMIEHRAIAILARTSAGDFAVFAVTLGLTVFRDLAEAIVAGFALGAILFIRRMSETTSVTGDPPLAATDQADRLAPYSPDEAGDSGTVVYRVTGTLFFGAAASVGAVLDRIAERRTTLILDLSDVPLIDSTGAHMLAGLAERSQRRGTGLVLRGTTPAMRSVLAGYGIGEPAVRFEAADGQSGS
ncbi:SulP family inorganic anion transporter [Hyphobacterium sp. WM6]|uniref:SulP family inorganic anion transporter n=1 Tax=Hyphobacterium sp. WM6 TaxID=3140243 RepID=UPI0031B689A0